MNNKRFKRYTTETIKLLKNQAIQAKTDACNSKKETKEYAEGVLTGYYSIISLLKHQACGFC